MVGAEVVEHQYVVSPGSVAKIILGRTLRKVLVGGRSANLEQVEAGLAWFYRHYADDVPEAGRAALDEREGRRGRRTQPTAQKEKKQ